uniref:Uncharacterized protein n=1 Tax=Ciona savignyi TaxID=51511 RepID=H2ZJD8_CIOSA
MDEIKTEEKITVLQNKAARDRIAARPQHRRARTRRVHVPANIKEESAVSEFDIPASIFAPIENAKKPDLPIEKEEEEKDKAPETKPNDLEEDVKSRRKSVGLDLAEEAAKKSSAVKKSRSFKSSLGSNVMVPSLNDVSKVKLRKTNSSASPKRSPSFGSRRLSPKEIEEPATEKSSSKSITKGLAHKLSFGKKNKPEGYEKSNKDSKNTDELKDKSSKDERPSKLNWIAGSKSKNEKQNVKSPTENTEPTAKSNLTVSPTGDDLAKALEK